MAGSDAGSGWRVAQLSRGARNLVNCCLAPYEVTSTDPITIAWAIAALVAVTMTAGVLPARRAVRIEPMTALRTE